MAGERTGCVLVVDDDSVVRTIQTEVLRGAGYRVLSAASGEEALEILGRHDVSVDVVLLDNHMPGTDGVGVLARLRGEPSTRTLPVILVTGDEEVGARVAGLAAGADDYVIKPFSPEELLARVGARLRERGAWDEVVASHMEERAAVARVLRAAASDGALEPRIQSLCDAFCDLRAVAAAGVFLFDGDAAATLVATSGEGAWRVETGTVLASTAARYVSMRATVGPWIDGKDEANPSALVQGAVAACAPIGRRDRLQGLLALVPAAGTGPREANHLLATAIDFAAMTEALLRSDLDQRGLHRRRQLQIEAVVRDGAFVSHFQPIVDLRDGGLPVVGVEALTRFDDGMSPEARFRFAAACGLGIELERVTLARALRDASCLDGGGWVSVNVSPTFLLTEDGLPERLAASDREIVLELSEQEPVDDYAALERRVRRLGPNVRLSVDDAGSGFASLRHILLLEPDYVKLDRTWVHGVDADPTRQALIAGLVHFTRQTGSRLIAEGIEAEAERRTLEELGVDYGQGYLLGSPRAVRR
ncbi:MAG TPA: EAL domain-containing protein [Acidimicrobiales bacterium]|nr:EAL domain-containing protein [Acidimicrobiales bacterium]